jgi:hypothetical protein
MTRIPSSRRRERQASIIATPGTATATAMAGAIAALTTGSSSVRGKTINPTNKRRRYVGTIVIGSRFKLNFPYQWFQVSALTVLKQGKLG